MNLKATIVLVMLVSLTWLVGCIDVSSTGPTPPTLESEFRFYNAAEDAGNVSITFDLGSAISGLDFGDASSHQTFPSGNRLAVLNNGDSLRIAMTSEQRSTIVILPQTGVVREFIKLIERRIDQPGTTSNALIRGVHASSDAGLTTFTIQNADTTVTSLPGVFRDFTTYISLPTGSYEFAVVTASGVTLTSTVDLSNIRQTVILIGNEANGTLDLIKLDDN